MINSEKRIQWLVSNSDHVGQWSPSGHKNGQFVSETAYPVTTV